MKRAKGIRQRLRTIWGKWQIRYLSPGKLRHLPDTLTIEVTNRCSLACSCCPNGLDKERCRPQHTLSRPDFERLLAQIDVPFSRVFLHLHGEPFLNRDLPAIASLLVERGVEEFSIFSNAYKVDASLLDQLLEVLKDVKINIAFSAELYDRQTYERLRSPGQFDRVWESMDQIDNVMARHHRDYSINAIIDARTVALLPTSVPHIFQRLRQLRDIHFSSAFPWPHLPETGDLAGHLKPRRSICSQIGQLPAIFSSGEVSMCNSDYRGECIVGSLWEQKYSQLINNPQARMFRRNIAIRHAERNTMCRDCLIDRHVSFSRTVRRTFVEKATEEVLQKYFNHYNKYFAIDGSTE